MKKTSKILSLALAAVLTVASLAGCGGQKVEDGKVALKVGNWISKAAEQDKIDEWAQKAADFEALYPDCDVIEGDTYTFDVKTFNARAAAGQLPTFMDVYFTEFQMIEKNKYNSDIKQALIDNGIYDMMKPEMLETVTTEDGQVIGIPSYGYAQGLAINKAIFEQAGLMNADGTPMVPQTWEELAETAKIIKEKTGIAGFVMPSTANCGGWIFMNIAYSNGVNFVELLEDGSWKAAFDTQEFRDSLQYLYDLKWKYNALPDNVLLDYAGFLKTFCVGQAAMTISDPNTIAGEVLNYQMNKDDLYMARIPEGSAGRVTQLGGGARVFFAGNTPEQNDYGVKWLMREGYTPFITEEVEANMRKANAEKIEKGGIVFPVEIFPIWESEERTAKMQEILADYANVDMKDFEDYRSFEGVTMKAEPDRCAQELYSILDKAVQEVWTNESADIEKLALDSLNDFQVNHLDKIVTE